MKKRNSDNNDYKNMKNFKLYKRGKKFPNDIDVAKESFIQLIKDMSDDEFLSFIFNLMIVLDELDNDDDYDNENNYDDDDDYFEEWESEVEKFYNEDNDDTKSLNNLLDDDDLPF